MRFDGEAVPSIENYDPDAREQWTRAWRLEDREYVRCAIGPRPSLNDVTAGFGVFTLLCPGPIDGPSDCPDKFEDRPAISRVTFDRCTVGSGQISLSGAVLDEVCFVDTKAELVLDDCALRHVVLAGRMGRVWALFGFQSHRSNYERLKRQNSDLHDRVDWMLDVSRAVSRDLILRSVRPDKVRIDPSRQAFVTHASLQPGRRHLEANPLVGNAGFIVRGALRSPNHLDSFICAQPRGKFEQEELALIRFLHEHGLTCPTAPHEPVAGGGEMPTPMSPDRARQRGRVDRSPSESGLPRPAAVVDPGLAASTPYFAADSLDHAREVAGDGTYLDHCWRTADGAPDPLSDLEPLIALVLDRPEEEIEWGAVTEIDDSDAVLGSVSPEFVRALASLSRAELIQLADDFEAYAIDFGEDNLVTLQSLSAFCAEVTRAGQSVYWIRYPGSWH